MPSRGTRSDESKVLDAMRSGEWLSLVWIAGTAFGEPTDLTMARVTAALRQLEGDAVVVSRGSDSEWTLIKDAGHASL